MFIWVFVSFENISLVWRRFTCFNDFGLSWPGFEHPTFHRRGHFKEKERERKGWERFWEREKLLYIFNLYFTEFSLIIWRTLTCDFWSHFLSFTVQFAPVDAWSGTIQTVLFTNWTFKYKRLHDKCCNWRNSCKTTLNSRVSRIMTVSECNYRGINVN